MLAKGFLTATLVCALAGAAGAEPVKAPAQAASQPSAQANVVLAAADIPARVEAPATASDSATPAPVKRPRAARVTTCRCGDTGEQH